MSAFRYAAFSGWNWTVVHGHSSVWFVFAGMNTVIALGCRPKKNASKKEKDLHLGSASVKKGFKPDFRLELVVCYLYSCLIIYLTLAQICQRFVYLCLFYISEHGIKACLF